MVPLSRQGTRKRKWGTTHGRDKNRISRMNRSPSAACSGNSSHTLKSLNEVKQKNMPHCLAFFLRVWLVGRVRYTSERHWKACTKAWQRWTNFHADQVLEQWWGGDCHLCSWVAVYPTASPWKCGEIYIPCRRLAGWGGGGGKEESVSVCLMKRIADNPHD